MSILTDFQIEFIRLLGASPLKMGFFLTGGTALSAYYLQHRYSEDLDFFTEQEDHFSRLISSLVEINNILQSEYEIIRNFNTFKEIHMRRGEQMLRCDFALDASFRLEPLVLDTQYGIQVDNRLDIACNKLSALFDRMDPKDFVDIYFIDREIIPFEQLVVEARKKHIGMDNYWLAAAFVKIKEFDILPRMIKPVTLAELRSFFQQKADWLMSTEL